jgi:hypothetical protein
MAIGNEQRTISYQQPNLTTWVKLGAVLPKDEQNYLFHPTRNLSVFLISVPSLPNVTVRALFFLVLFVRMNRINYQINNFKRCQGSKI